MRKSTAEILRERLAESPPVIRCVEISHQIVPMITFSLWGAGDWLLPLSRLEAIRFVPGKDEERLEFIFPNHHIIVSGVNFASTVDDLRESKVWLLRNLPREYRASLEAKETFVARLDVRSSEDQKIGSSE